MKRYLYPLALFVASSAFGEDAPGLRGEVEDPASPIRLALGDAPAPLDLFAIPLISTTTVNTRDLQPVKITDSGYILLRDTRMRAFSTSNSSQAIPLQVGFRWRAGKFSALDRASSGLVITLYDQGFPYGFEHEVGLISVSDIDESGRVVGRRASDVSLSGFQTDGHLEYFYEPVLWPNNSAAASSLPVDDLTRLTEMGSIFDFPSSGSHQSYRGPVSVGPPMIAAGKVYFNYFDAGLYVPGLALRPEHDREGASGYMTTGLPPASAKKTPLARALGISPDGKQVATKTYGEPTDPSTPPPEIFKLNLVEVRGPLSRPPNNAGRYLWAQGWSDIPLQAEDELLQVLDATRLLTPLSLNSRQDILTQTPDGEIDIWYWVPLTPGTGEPGNGLYQELDLKIHYPPDWTLKTLAPSMNAQINLIGTLERTAVSPLQPTAPAIFVPAALWTDYDRNGQITPGLLADYAKEEAPFRFWSNDDDDSGDISATGPSLLNNPDEPGYLSGFWEMDGRTPDHDHPGVDGRSDLLDFFPVYLDIKQLLAVLPHTTAGITYKLKQADSALNFVYTNLTRTEAFDYLKYNKERVAYGLPSDQKKAHEAPTVAITAAGAPLDADFLARIKNEADKGVILIEGKLATDKPLRLVVEKAGVEIAEVALNIKISEVEKMYRWINTRGVTGQSVTRPTDLSQPTGYPDSATNGKMFIFVHGYNVNERQSRAWNSEAFKRMYQSGSRAMFTAVSWNGDHSQIPYVGVAPDYWDNITRAFKTAQALAPIVNGLPGSTKIIAGHSMANVVVSSAITDYGLNVTKYLMVDAAVPLESYDTSALAVNAMRHPDWAIYTDRRVWPTDWYNLFPSGDGRRGLTWMDRFGNIPNGVNIYSSGEEVLNNNDLTPGQIPPVGPERVWIIQEMAKGTMHLAALLTFDIQGGWGFNSEWWIAETTTTGGPHGGTTTAYRNRTPTEAATLTDAQLQAEPFFRRFQNANFRSPTAGSAAAADPVARADALGGAIPALSFPAGRNAVPAFNNRNRDLMTLQDGWPQARLNDQDAQNRWFHSDIKNIAYVFNRGAWDLFVTEGNLK